MTPEEMEMEAARMEETAHVQLALAFVNFQGQMGGAAALRDTAAKERNRPTEELKAKEPEEAADGA